MSTTRPTQTLLILNAFLWIARPNSMLPLFFIQQWCRVRPHSVTLREDDLGGLTPASAGTAQCGSTEPQRRVWGEMSLFRPTMKEKAEKPRASRKSENQDNALFEPYFTEEREQLPFSCHALQHFRCTPQLAASNSAVLTCRFSFEGYALCSETLPMSTMSELPGRETCDTDTGWASSPCYS
jgi:hypothetical protein